MWVLGAARKVEIKLSGHLEFGIAALAKLAQPMSLRLGPSLANEFTMLSSRQAGGLAGKKREMEGNKNTRMRNLRHMFMEGKSFFQAPK